MVVGFFTNILDEGDVWGINDFDTVQSIASNAFDNECRTHECSDAFLIDKVKVIDINVCRYYYMKPIWCMKYDSVICFYRYFLLEMTF